jgi:hypothetical protein
MDWTEEELLALAPDAFSLRRAQEFATPACWTALGRNATGAWGTHEVAGLLIHTGFDLTSADYTCVCQGADRRRAPCGHTLGLRLLLARQPAVFANPVPPAWFTGWRAAQAQAAAAGTVVAFSAERWHDPTPWSVEQILQCPDSPALLAHQQRVVEALAQWLRDLVAAGLQHVPPGEMDYSQLELSPWQHQEYTLLNWELLGLAEAVRTLAGQCTGEALSEAAQDQLLLGLAKLYRLTQVFLRRAQLPPAAQQAVGLRIGLPFLDQARLRAQQPAVADIWHVLMQRTAPDQLWGGSWQQRRTWLWGQATGRYALVLEMQWNHTPFPTELAVAGHYAGHLVFYPAPEQWRAVPAADWPDPVEAVEPATQPGGLSLAELPLGYAAARAQAPWLDEWPVTLGPLVPVMVTPDQVYLYDAATQQRLPLRGTAADQWQLLAGSGGAPLLVFGEWDGQTLRPLAHWLAPTFPHALAP